MMTMDSNMTRSRRTIGNMWEYSDQDHQQLEHTSFHHHHNTTQTPPQYSDNATNSPFDQSPSPYSITTSPFSKSPWSNTQSTDESYYYSYNNTGLIGSLIREEGHIYSLAAYGDFLYTGSDSKNIRVWKNQIEFCGFKSSSGLVKAIIVTGDRIFSGHQDGKIRVWKVSGKDPSAHKRIATLPTFKAKIKSSLNPGNYVEVNKNRNAIWIKHTDVISSLSLSQDKSLLYSASWDRMIKVWRVSDFKCLESITAHDDAVNSIVDGFDGLVFTGSADGSVKVWRRETQGKGTKHFFSQTLLQQECAVTALAVDPSSSILYSGSSDGLINFWERYKFLSHGGVLRSHKLAVLCLATAGNLVFSGSADKNICVWRREDGGHICLSVLSGHTGPVKCLTVLDEDKGTTYSQHDDRQYVVYSGSLDKSVKIWKVSGRSGGTRTPPFPPHTSPQSLPSFLNSLKQDSKKYGRPKE